MWDGWMGTVHVHLEPTPAARALLAAFSLPWTMSAALSDDLTDLTPSPPPSQMPLPKKKDVESGSELSEPPSEDDRPHNNNKPTTKKPRTGRGIVPAPMWEWAKKKPTKPVDDDDDDDEDNEDDDEGDVADADKTTNDDDADDKLLDAEDDAEDKADDTTADPDADHNLSAAAADAPDADHTKDSKKTNGIVLNGISHNSFLYAVAHDRYSRTTQRRQRRRQ
jgi:hypothetical protein